VKLVTLAQLETLVQPVIPETLVTQAPPVIQVILAIQVRLVQLAHKVIREVQVHLVQLVTLAQQEIPA
jgi:hypothetical protein